MTTFYLVGGEDSEFSPSGNCAVDTTAGHFRANYARCALKTTVAGAITNFDGWFASLGASRSSFWATAQLFLTGTGSGFSANYSLLMFKDGPVARLLLRTNPVTNGGGWQLVKQSAGNVLTTLATTSLAPQGNVLTRIDAFVSYGVSGRFQLYVGGNLVLDYSGDLTTDSATGLDGIGFGGWNFSNGTGTSSFSEVIVADSDTRAMSLASLTPLATGNTAAWTGAVTDINETTLNDATTANTATAAQLEEFTVTPATAIGSTTGVLAVIVSARAAKGSTGPQNLQAAVRTGAADYVSGNLPVAAVLAPVQGVFATNPATSAVWAGSDLTAAGFNIGLKSIA